MDPEILVLLSGGVDSSACVNFYLELGRPVCGLFVDYGQPAAAEETRSAVAVAEYYKIPLKQLALQGRRDKSVGLIQGRNLFLISAAIMERSPSIFVIAMGIHSGTNYPDCSQQFLTQTQAILNLFESKRLHLVAPFLAWSKAAVYAYCLNHAVPTELTYSCESGGAVPCGRCLSCKDRKLLNASSPVKP